MRSRAFAIIAAVLMAGAILSLPGASPAQAGSAGWIVTCNYARSAPDDPIVAPGIAGGSHLHDFLGNKATSATSTYQSMTSGSSTCGTATDLAANRAPALLRSDGTQVRPTGTFAGRSTRQRVYYRADNLRTGTKVEAFPADLRLVAGNSHATSLADNPELGGDIYWGCSDNSTGKLKAPPASCSTGIITLHVGFPNCWDGVLTHKNDTAHVRYPSGGVCPTGFGHALPRIIERMEYPVGTTTGSVKLSSGPTFTAHADFWNTWNQPALARLVANCLNAGVDCGKDPA